MHIHELEDFEAIIDLPGAEFGPAASSLFRGWREEPLLSSRLFQKVMEKYIGTPETPGLREATRAALILADERNGNAYHNHHHNREVISLTLAMLIRHRRESLQPELNTDTAWLTMIAAAIHDYRHDGTSNKSENAIIPMRLERKSLEDAKEQLLKAGLSARDWLKLSMMVLPTDITPTDKPSPSAQLKEIFRYHSQQQHDFSHIDPLFLSLIYDPELTMCSEILGDADLGVSAGLDPAMAELNSRCLEQETDGAVPATAKSFKGFLDYVCHGFPASPAGRELLRPGHIKIRHDNTRKLNFATGLDNRME